MEYPEWFLIGLVFVFFELFLPGAYLVWFGLSAFSMGALVLFWPLTLANQLILFACVSAVFAVIGWRVYDKAMQKQPPEKYKNLNDPASQLIGQVVVLTEDVVDGRTKVKVGDTVWLAACEAPLKAGSSVKITGVRDGVILDVKNV